MRLLAPAGGVLLAGPVPPATLRYVPDEVIAVRRAGAARRRPGAAPARRTGARPAESP